MCPTPVCRHVKVKVVFFYIAQYPVRWTAQSASHFLPSLTDLFIPTPFSASPGSILARQQLRAKTKSLTFPPLSIARYSFIQLSEQGRLWSERKMPNLRNGSKGGFEPGLSRLRVRHSTTELLRSMYISQNCITTTSFQITWPMYHCHLETPMIFNVSLKKMVSLVSKYCWLQLISKPFI